MLKTLLKTSVENIDENIDENNDDSMFKHLVKQRTRNRWLGNRGWRGHRKWCSSKATLLSWETPHGRTVDPSWRERTERNRERENGEGTEREQRENGERTENTRGISAD
jgi:hypothetical protein